MSARRRLQDVLAAMSDEQALAVWNALGQWADNARAAHEEDDVELSVGCTATQLADVEAVVDALNGVVASVADAPAKGARTRASR